LRHKGLRHFPCLQTVEPEPQPSTQWSIRVGSHVKSYPWVIYRVFHSQLKYKLFDRMAWLSVMKSQYYVQILSKIWGSVQLMALVEHIMDPFFSKPLFRFRLSDMAFSCLFCLRDNRYLYYVILPVGLKFRLVNPPHLVRNCCISFGCNWDTLQPVSASDPCLPLNVLFFHTPEITSR